MTSGEVTPFGLAWAGGKTPQTHRSGTTKQERVEPELDGPSPTQGLQDPKLIQVYKSQGLQ